MVIDFHAHVYPRRIAAAASESIGRFYDIKTDFAGDTDTLLKLMDRGGIARAVIHSAAMVPSKAGAVNRFIAGEVNAHPGRFIGFGTLHPDMTADEIHAELKNALALGLKGIKIHNDMIRVAIDDPKMDKIYDACQDVCPLLLHMGDRRYHYDTPSQLPYVLRNFPRLKVIGAHMGGYSQWDEAKEYLKKENVIVDCSSSRFVLGDRGIYDLIRFFGPDRVLFGSDFPMWDPADELASILRMDFSDEEKEKILHKNAEDLLNGL